MTNGLFRFIVTLNNFLSKRIANTFLLGWIIFNVIDWVVQEND